MSGESCTITHMTTLLMVLTFTNNNNVETFLVVKQNFNPYNVSGGVMGASILQSAVIPGTGTDATFTVIQFRF